MTRRTSPKPDWFADWREEQYWHGAQRVAYDIGAAIILRDGSTWLVSDDGERLVCTPERPRRIWFETWKALVAEHRQPQRTRSTEAETTLRAFLATFRARTYSDLVTLIDVVQVEEQRGASGANYELRASVFWDDEPGGNVRVLASLEGGERRFYPACEDFIMAPDGRFVGE